MNKHVPPPDDAQTRPTKPVAAPAEHASDVQELPSRGRAEAKSLKPGPQPDHAPHTRKVESDQQQKPESAAEDSKPLQRSFWTRRHLVFAGLAGFAALGAFLLWPAGGSAPKIVYSVASVASGTVQLSVHAPAVLEPRNAIDVVAVTGGRIESLAVRSGDRVTKGQRLARLTSDSPRDELIAAQAELAARQAGLARAEADAAEARAAAERARNDSKPGAADAAAARLARTLANVNESHAQLRAGEASLAEARAAVDGLDVRAPIDGIVLKTNLDSVNGVRSIARGQPLLTIAADLSQLNLRANFAENSLASLKVGQRAEFTTPAFPRRSLAATLTALDVWPKREIVDGKPATTYASTLMAANPDGALRPGMSADVAIIIAEARNVLVVPNTALSFTPLQKIESQYPPLKTSATGPRMGRVWVKRDDIVKPRDIVLGLSDGRITQVVSGPLSAGDDVITSAQVAARGGQP